ncbi:hypothetical protein HMPREF0321_1936 [Dermacoccus sp. Ellin185]|nr:hypothetical protein HMPREF0321_1936 [Dermacoccus sp. Ellin185]
MATIFARRMLPTLSPARAFPQSTISPGETPVTVLAGRPATTRKPPPPRGRQGLPRRAIRRQHMRTITPSADDPSA